MTTPPTQAQPSFYDAVKADLKYDPMTARDFPPAHEDFLAQNNFSVWRDEMLSRFDAHVGQFDGQHRTKRQRAKRVPAPRPPTV